MRFLRALRLDAAASGAAEWLWRLLSFPFVLAAPVLGPPLSWFAKHEARLPERLREGLEWGVVALGLISLWPYILGVRGPWYGALLGAVIALLAAVAVCRFYRVKWALEERLGQREDGAPYAPLPGVPMPPPHPPHKGNGRDD